MEQGRALGHTMIGCDVAYADPCKEEGKPQLFFPARSLQWEHLKGVDRVIHSAGQLGTAETFTNPTRAVHENIVETLLVLEKCIEVGLPITYITLGNNWYNPYSITKNCAADFVRMYGQVHDLRTQVAVTYNVFGPYQKWKPVRKIVPEFMTRLLSGKPVELFFGGHTQVDMVYAPDVARAILENEDSGTHYYGSGVARSVKSVAEYCAHALKLRCSFIILGARQGETGPAAIASEPLRNQTPYPEAMKITADWYRANYRP